MTEKLRPFVAPAYLFLCLLLGGSAQGVWGNALLQLLATAIIAWALLDWRGRALPRRIKQLLILIGTAAILALIQLIPLPTPIWASLSGRAQFLEGFQILDVVPAAMPISFDPYGTLATLLSLLPPMGMIAALIGNRDWSGPWLAASMVVGTVTAVLLGILQVTSADPVHSNWYLYRQSNFGVATGFFANSNHMASLLLATIPFIAALGVTVRERSKDVRLRSAALAIVGGGLVVVVLGLILNGSLAGFLLGLPVILASMVMLFGTRAGRAGGILAGVAIASFAALAMLWASPLNRGAATSVSSRQTILSNGVDLLGEFGLVGTGLGTFEKVYRLTEEPGEVDRYYVNHAHNDYLELAVENGLPGSLLMLMFIVWWGRSVWEMRGSASADQFAFAGAVSSAALLLHSAVDYPLRTAAMSAVFAMCLVMIVQSRRTGRTGTDLRPVRHVVVS